MQKSIDGFGKIFRAYSLQDTDDTIFNANEIVYPDRGSKATDFRPSLNS